MQRNIKEYSLPTKRHNQYELQVSVDYGTVVIDAAYQSKSLHYLEGSRFPSSNLLLRGDLDTVNVALSGIFYTPPHHWTTQAAGHSDTVHFIAEDQGNGDDGGPTLTSVAELAIEVISGANDKPVVRVPGATVVTGPCEAADGTVSISDCHADGCALPAVQ